MHPAYLDALALLHIYLLNRLFYRGNCRIHAVITINVVGYKFPFLKIVMLNF